MVQDQVELVVVVPAGSLASSLQPATPPAPPPTLAPLIVSPVILVNRCDCCDLTV